MKLTLAFCLTSALAVATPAGAAPNPDDAPVDAPSTRVSRVQYEAIFGTLTGFGFGALTTLAFCRGATLYGRECAAAIPASASLGVTTGVALAGWADASERDSAFDLSRALFTSALGQALGLAIGYAFVAAGASDGYFRYVPLMAFAVAGTIAGFEASAPP